MYSNIFSTNPCSKYISITSLSFIYSKSTAISHQTIDNELNTDGKGKKRGRLGQNRLGTLQYSSEFEINGKENPSIQCNLHKHTCVLCFILQLPDFSFMFFSFSSLATFLIQTAMTTTSQRGLKPSRILLWFLPSFLFYSFICFCILSF